MVLASDNLTYLPTPQLTIREQPFHTTHLPTSYISRPYTIIAFLFFGAFRFRLPRQYIENALPLNFITMFGIARMATRGSTARQRTGSDSTARNTGKSSASARQIENAARVDSEVKPGDTEDVMANQRAFIQDLVEKQAAMQAEMAEQQASMQAEMAEQRASMQAQLEAMESRQPPANSNVLCKRFVHLSEL
jgi:hypothetical protein